MIDNTGKDEAMFQSNTLFRFVKVRYENMLLCRHISMLNVIGREAMQIKWSKAMLLNASFKVQSMDVCGEGGKHAAQVLCPHKN